MSLHTHVTRQRRPRIHRASHLAWIRTLPCLITGKREAVEAAHIRYADRRFAKRATGMAEKPDDKWTVPLSASLHRVQHMGGEREFWSAHGIDPCIVALALFACEQDDDAAEQIIAEARNHAATGPEAN